MAVDPGGDTQPENPQSWNKYAYVRNNPIKAVDPTGKQEVPYSQQVANQLAATAVRQQTAAQGRATEAAEQAKTLKAVGDAVCTAAPVVGEGAGLVSAGFVAAAPFTGGTSLAPATGAGMIAGAADSVALVCEPSNPERVIALGADILGAAAEASTAKVLRASPKAVTEVKAIAAALTGAAASAAVRPGFQQSLADISP